MASRCSRIFQRSAISTLKSAISKPASSSSRSATAAPTRPPLPSKSVSSPLRRFSLSRTPSELGGVASMLPLHSTVANARMTSCLSSSSRSCRALSQVKPRVPPTASERKRKARKALTSGPRESSARTSQSRATSNAPQLVGPTVLSADATTNVGGSSSHPTHPNPSTTEVGGSSSQPRIGHEIEELMLELDKHVSRLVLSGDERSSVRIRNHTTMLEKWELTPFIADVVERSGLMPIVRSSYKAIDGHLVMAFIERWQPGICTFHLPVGEMTITLDDVSALIGLPVVGVPVYDLEYLRRKKEQGCEVVARILGESPTQDSSGWGPSKKSLKLEWLRDTFSRVRERDSEERKKYAARAYLLFLLGCTIFADKTENLVGEYVIEDLDIVGRYAWYCYSVLSLPGAVFGFPGQYEADMWVLDATPKLDLQAFSSFYARTEVRTASGSVGHTMGASTENRFK